MTNGGEYERPENEQGSPRNRIYLEEKVSGCEIRFCRFGDR